MRYAFDVAWIPAMNRNPIVAREMIKAMEMREISSLGMRLFVLFQILWQFVLSFFRREKPTLFEAPPRAEFMTKLPASALAEPAPDAVAGEDALG